MNNGYDRVGRLLAPAHCRAVGQRLSAFIDDEPETVDALRSGGIQVHLFDQVSGLRVRELRATLTVGNRDPGR